MQEVDKILFKLGYLDSDPHKNKRCKVTSTRRRNLCSKAAYQTKG